jgi:hypothetical protein
MKKRKTKTTNYVYNNNILMIDFFQTEASFQNGLSSEMILSLTSKFSHMKSIQNHRKTITRFL